MREGKIYKPGQQDPGLFHRITMEATLLMKGLKGCLASHCGFGCSLLTVVGNSPVLGALEPRGCCSPVKLWKAELVVGTLSDSRALGTTET